MSEIYNADQIIDKTLFAAKTVRVYDWPDESFAAVKAVTVGDPVGRVYSWVTGTPGISKYGLWWMLWPETPGGDYLYVPHKEGDFSITALQQQGALTPEQIRALKEEQNKAWYNEILSQALPYATIAILGAAAIRGYLSRPASPSKNV